MILTFSAEPVVVGFGSCEFDAYRTLPNSSTSILSLGDGVAEMRKEARSHTHKISPLLFFFGEIEFRLRRSLYGHEGFEYPLQL
jgi:hypothetical protein